MTPGQRDMNYPEQDAVKLLTYAAVVAPAAADSALVCQFTNIRQ